MIKYLLEDDLPMIRTLVDQSPTYFGQPVSTEMVLKPIVAMMANLPQQSFLGYVERGRLTCMMGQRMSLRSPTWIENFVYLDKRKTKGLYNLRASHFLDVLDFAIEVAEAQHRHSFLTAMRDTQLMSRMAATKRAIRHTSFHRLKAYVPSIWYQSQAGDFADATVLFGPTPVPNSTVLQWVKPLNKDLLEHDFVAPTRHKS